ncbi:MAG: AMP-binding protein, partial [Snowella sp.]
MALFLGAIAADFSVFIGNPQWQQQEWQQVEQLLNLGGNYGKTIVLPGSASNSLVPSPAILIPTGGSSGKIRFAIHTCESLSNSVAGFQQYFGVYSVNSFCVLPLYHVGGLMQFFRSFLTGGKLLTLPYKDLKKGERGGIVPEEFFISLVPTQLQFLLKYAPDWLSQFSTVMVGGADINPSLLTAARKQKIPIAPTYGMTETASQIATLKPDDFLKGYSNSGRILPHAKIKIIGDRGQLFGENQTGIIAIESRSLCRGYYP